MCIDGVILPAACSDSSRVKNGLKIVVSEIAPAVWDSRASSVDSPFCRLRRLATFSNEEQNVRQCTKQTFPRKATRPDAFEAQREPEKGGERTKRCVGV